ncbi:MAG: polyprenyl synthetase family protein [Micrococcus sp.]|nr:polyprenyl synthetase family protein [Micrococcus sp.]
MVAHAQQGMETFDEHRAAVQRRLDKMFTEQRGSIETVHPDAAALLDSVAALSRGGKRLRALLAWMGYRAAGGHAEATRIVEAGAAVEVFQSAALIHDDILDRSDTRRGQPSVHRQFETLHRDSGWRSASAHFGQSAAILAGDLALALADASFHAAIEGSPRAARAREEMQTMRWEVMAGQYLDVLAEVMPPAEDPVLAAQRAARVVEFKSARYTAVHPTSLGILLAGGSDALVRACSAVTLPFGLAYQYHDDLLGVFGDAAQTGKPSGDDLREGKRTVLIAHAHAVLPAQDIASLEADLGREDLDEDRIRHWQDRLTDSGVRQRVEAEVSRLHDEAFAALHRLTEEGAACAAVEDLRRLMDSLMGRNA